MNQDLRNRFEARDAFGIVSSQVDDGALPLMCESVFESAQFAVLRPRRSWVFQETRRRTGDCCMSR